jgi:hypothetical protein
MQESPSGLKELGSVKANLSKQEFTWKKRMWPIKDDYKDAIWEDKKGISHLHVNVNEADGTYHFITPAKLNLYGFEKNEDGSYKMSAIDMCAQCGDRISIDAINTRDLMKRKTITSYWGVDSSHVMLLLILGVAVMIAMAIIMYMYGENQKLVATITTLKTPIITSPTESNTAQFILGGLFR